MRLEQTEYMAALGRPSTWRLSAAEYMAALRLLSVGLFVVSGLLLVSMGGAVFAAPATLPLMWLAVRRHPTRSFRWAGGVIAALTAVELAWAVVYVLGGEGQPSIWLVPLVTGLCVLTLFATARRRERLSTP